MKFESIPERWVRPRRHRNLCSSSHKERCDLLSHRRWLPSGREDVNVDGWPETVAVLKAVKLNHEAANQRPLALGADSFGKLEG